MCEKPARFRQRPADLVERRRRETKPSIQIFASDLDDAVGTDARKVLRDLVPLETEVETKDGRWLMMRLRPYRAVEDRIDGVVLSFGDITQRRKAQEALRLGEERHREMCDTLLYAAVAHGADPAALAAARARLLAELDR